MPFKIQFMHIMLILQRRSLDYSIFLSRQGQSQNKNRHCLNVWKCLFSLPDPNFDIYIHVSVNGIARYFSGAFLIPFLVLLLCCGIPLFFLEAAAAQFTGKGPLHLFEICPILKGNVIYRKHVILYSLVFTRGIQKLMQLGDFLEISYNMLLKIDGTP